MGNGTESDAVEQPAPKPRPPVKPSDADLDNRFRYHPPKTNSRVAKHAKVTELTLELAKHIRDICPAGRGLACALTALEEARMWANQALACDSTNDE